MTKQEYEAMQALKNKSIGRDVEISEYDALIITHMINNKNKEIRELKEKLMSKKVRIIDIFGLIANGLTPPKKIKYDFLEEDYQILIYAPEEQEYRFKNDLDNIWTVPNHHLKDTVEILEV